METADVEQLLSTANRHTHTHTQQYDKLTRINSNNISPFRRTAPSTQRVCLVFLSTTFRNQLALYTLSSLLRGRERGWERETGTTYTGTTLTFLSIPLSLVRSVSGLRPSWCIKIISSLTVFGLWKGNSEIVWMMAQGGWVWTGEKEERGITSHSFIRIWNLNNRLIIIIIRIAWDTHLHETGIVLNSN